MPEQTPERLLAAQVGKPHGLKGDVYVVPISDDPRRFDPGSVLEGERGPLVVESSRRHGGRLLVKFEGVESREDAESVRGALYVTSTQLRELDDDEYWPHELEGATVLLADGSEIGRLVKVAPGAAHDLLVVDTPRGERLVPFVKDIVTEVRPDEGRIVLSPPEGLLD